MVENSSPWLGVAELELGPSNFLLVQPMTPMTPVIKTQHTEGWNGAVFYPISENVVQVFVLIWLDPFIILKTHIFQKKVKHAWKEPDVFFFTLIRLSIGHRNSWHQKAPVWLYWRLTILSVGHQKPLISSFQTRRTLPENFGNNCQ